MIDVSVLLRWFLSKYFYGKVVQLIDNGYREKCEEPGPASTGYYNSHHSLENCLVLSWVSRVRNCSVFRLHVAQRQILEPPCKRQKAKRLFGGQLGL
jgi:hypothetical protein